MKTYCESEWRVGPVRPGKDFAGFTLVEMMVAMAVLVLLLTLLAQATGFITMATSITQKQISATQTERTVMDALEADLANAVTQNGMTVFVRQDSQDPPNVQLAFLTRGRGPSSTSPTTLRFMAVAYLLNGNMLTRRVTPVLWSTVDLNDAVVGTATSTTNQFSVLSNSILRLEAVVQLDDGSIAPLSTSNPSWLANASQGFSGFVLTTSPVSASATPRVRSIIVAISALDGQLLRLPGASTMGRKLRSTPAGETPLDYWDSQIASGVLNAYPKPVVAGLEIYQRICQLR